MRRVLTASIIAFAAAAPCFMAPALAKLPPLSDEAKAKAAETAAKNAWTAKVDNYALCQAMDRTVEHYRKSAPTMGKTAPPGIETPPCSDPGPFVAPVAAAPRPLEAAGAHSPPASDGKPPNSNATEAELNGQPKK